jgi:hypothetical protein
LAVVEQGGNAGKPRPPALHLNIVNGWFFLQIFFFLVFCTDFVRGLKTIFGRLKINLFFRPDNLTNFLLSSIKSNGFFH